MCPGDGTHNKKQRISTGMTPITKNGHKNSLQEGMIPIAKNITVVDENGKEYEPTYLKRAEGLVKNGRARFVAQDKICLSRPPSKKSEDKLMSENKDKKQKVNPNVERAMNFAEKFVTEKQKGFEMSLEYIMDKINQIMNDKEYILNTIEALTIVANGEHAAALGTVVEAREKTNRQLLSLFEKVLDYHLAKPETKMTGGMVFPPPSDK